MLRKLMYLIFPAWIFVAFCKRTKRGKRLHFLFTPM